MLLLFMGFCLLFMGYGYGIIIIILTLNGAWHSYIYRWTNDVVKIKITPPCKPSPCHSELQAQVEARLRPYT
jgi:hypothetical protein